MLLLQLVLLLVSIVSVVSVVIAVSAIIISSIGEVCYNSTHTWSLLLGNGPCKMVATGDVTNSSVSDTVCKAISKQSQHQCMNTYIPLLA